jgi:hypothetical protein
MAIIFDWTNPPYKLINNCILTNYQLFQVLQIEAATF